ncbi:hypothetical protein BV881_05975 [Streptomyces sp. ZL-24]|uniref:hypothetical protein n=1 Tax=Streptomyces sp. ZL-24 TaxID=1933029 RepID=UPI000CD3B29D|nr:hypothetical protein [Streptomyces sp. ZL-24]POG48555.1 hypothetical protein BV881_05975 [Streptomyces sp. ZL-24]
MARKDRTMVAAAERDREKWMARFQVRLAMQPGVDRAVVLQAVKEVTAHCAETGEHPRTHFGDPDAYAVEAAARLVPADRAARAKRHNGVLKTVESVVKKIRDVPGL